MCLPQSKPCVTRLEGTSLKTAILEKDDTPKREYVSVRRVLQISFYYSNLIQRRMKIVNNMLWRCERARVSFEIWNNVLLSSHSHSKHIFVSTVGFQGLICDWFQLCMRRGASSTTSSNATCMHSQKGPRSRLESSGASRGVVEHTGTSCWYAYCMCTYCTWYRDA